jgi:hypothetical protein
MADNILDPSEMKNNAEILVRHIVEGAPTQLGCVVIFFNKEGGGAQTATTCANGKELGDILRSALVTCEQKKSPSLVLVKPS